MRAPSRDPARAVVAFLLLVAALALPALARGGRPPGEDLSDPESRALALKEVSDHLLCQCGCNMVLSECSHQNCGWAIPERGNIMRKVEQGMSDEEIVAEYVRDYGRAILTVPPPEGTWMDRAAWRLPVAFGVIGILLTAWLAFRWSRRLSGTATVAPAGGEVATRDPWLDRIKHEVEGKLP